MSDAAAILARYPKRRPPLPAEYRRIYEREYKLNREGGSFITSLSSRLESWMHRRVAAVPAADDQQCYARLCGVCGAPGDVGPFDEFSLAADAGGGERGSKFFAQSIPRRRSGPAAAVNQDLRDGRAFRTGGRDQPPAVCGAMLNTANLCPSGSRK